MIPKLSIVIPCYNTELTLRSTLNSVLEQEFQDWEAILVNDGSPDNLESIAKEFVDLDSRFIYFKKQNGGLGSARNYGITRAKGEFILPLDSDNKIEKKFTLAGIPVFRNNPNVGVVYGNAEFYGEKTGFWKVKEFDLKEMLVQNYIDACAIYRKTLWDQVGGYDENMPYQGHEDWEFWLALATLKVDFYHLHKASFKYFFSKNSMIRSFTEEMNILNQDYIVKKHSKLFHDKYCKLVVDINEVKFNDFKKLKNKKFVINLFCYTFFRFIVFKNNFDNFK